MLCEVDILEDCSNNPKMLGCIFIGDRQARQNERVKKESNAIKERAKKQRLMELED